MMTMSAIFGTLSRAACSRAPKSLFMLSCYWLLTVTEVVFTPLLPQL